MEIQEQQVETTEAVESQASPESAAPEQQNAVEAHIASVEAKKSGVAPQVAQTPAFAPDFKVKAYEQEYEIPENFRQFIKDDMTNKEFKKLFEKAYGFEHLYPKFHKTNDRYKATKTEYDTFRKDAEPVLGVYQQATKYLEKGDFDSLFEMLGIDDQKLYKHVDYKLSLQGPQKDAYIKQREAQKRAYELENQQAQKSTEAEAWQQRYEELETKQRTQELQTVLSRPEIAEFASQIDQKLGENAFLQEVIQRAAFHYQQNKEDLSAEQAVLKTFNHLKSIYGGTQSVEQATQKANQVAATKKNSVPVIPNVSSNTGSPISKKITSLDDLKKAIASQQQ